MKRDKIESSKEFLERRAVKQDYAKWHFEFIGDRYENSTVLVGYNAWTYQQTKINTLTKQVEVLKEAVEFVAGVDSIEHWEKELPKGNKGGLIDAMLSDIRACKQALEKYKELCDE